MTYRGGKLSSIEVSALQAAMFPLWAVVRLDEGDRITARFDQRTISRLVGSAYRRGRHDGRAFRKAEVEREIGKLDLYYDKRLETAYAELDELRGFKKEAFWALHKRAGSMAHLLADVLWWFRGATALAARRLGTIPDQGELGQLRLLLHDLDSSARAHPDDQIPF